jgi:hypothetical protein
MDLQTLRAAVRTLATTGTVPTNLLAELSEDEQKAVFGLEEETRKAGKLSAVVPPSHTTMWF